jgi:hypothetical protein
MSELPMERDEGSAEDHSFSELPTVGVKKNFLMLGVGFHSQQ